MKNILKKILNKKTKKIIKKKTKTVKSFQSKKK